MNQQKICTACGTQFPLSGEPLTLCPICADDRQFIPESGQSWTDHPALSANYSVITKKLDEHLYELRMAPSFAIAQRALLILTPGGNILWDCFALLNEPTIAFIKSKGGLKAIAFSHPHYYSTMNDWAAVFDCPIYIHHSDEEWIFNKGPHISLWAGEEHKLWDGIRIIHIGGHFPGSCILHVPFLSPRGTVLCGDTLAISPNKKHISVMYSYPNRVPLPVKEMRRIRNLLLPLPFDTLLGYAAFLNIYTDAKEILESSLAKYE